MAPLSSEIGGSTSTNLIQRAQASDIEAWERLSHLYGPLIYQWARTSGLQEQDASDVMQEVFHALARKLPSYQRRRDVGSFRGWLWTISRHKIVDHFRRIRESPQGAGGTDAYDRLQQLPEQLELSDEQSVIDAQGLRALLEAFKEIEEVGQFHVGHAEADLVFAVAFLSLGHGALPKLGDVHQRARLAVATHRHAVLVERRGHLLGEAEYLLPKALVYFIFVPRT